jgi:hypothetical protein
MMSHIPIHVITTRAALFGAAAFGLEKFENHVKGVGVCSSALGVREKRLRRRLEEQSDNEWSADCGRRIER